MEPYTKLERRARSPATEENATIDPCPCAVIRSPNATPTPTAAV